MTTQRQSDRVNSRTERIVAWAILLVLVAGIGAVFALAPWLQWHFITSP